MTREERHIAVLSRLLENMDVYDSVQPTEERKKAIKAAIQALSQEPTVQDKQAESEKYQKAFDDGYANGYAQARFDYEQEPCDDAISRKSILKYIDEWWSDSRDDIEELIIYITYLPSVTQKSGKWIDIPDNATNGDVIKAIFPNSDIEEHRTYMKIVEGDYLLPCAYQWWNAPYCGDHMKGADK